VALTGSLSEVAAADVIQLIGMGRKTGVLTIVGKEDRALLYFDEGRPVHAVYGGMTGEEAVYSVLTLTSGDFSFEAAEVDCPRTISDDIQGLILEGVRRLDHCRLAKSSLPPPDAMLEARAEMADSGVRASLSEQEGAMLGLLSEPRLLADVLRLSGLPDLQGAEVLWQLLSRGLVGVAQPVAHPEEPTGVAATQERVLAASDVRRIMERIATL
jgi:hypothetical protein